MVRIVSFISYSFLVILTIAGCSHHKPKEPPREALFTEVDFHQLDGWNDENHLKALEVFLKSCSQINKKQEAAKVSRLTDLGGHAKEWHRVCRAASHYNKDDTQAKLFFEKHFIPYKIRTNTGSDIGRFTGYYEIELEGSKKKSSEYQYPIYRAPNNLKLIKGKNFLSHKNINRGSLAKQGLEIAWVNNKARLFFMHIQGSGVVKLKEGGEMKLHYAGENGFAYKAIGRLFKEYGATGIDSATAMMKWLHNNPKTGLEIMEKNPSYVFFEEVNGPSPIGAQNIPLIPERSLAVDSGLYPYGAPFWLETVLPKTKNMTSKKYHRLFIAQDTGGAIKGAIRGDIFFGRGTIPEELAGYMNNKGKYYIFIPKTINMPKIYKAKIH